MQFVCYLCHMVKHGPEVEHVMKITFFKEQKIQEKG